MPGQKGSEADTLERFFFCKFLFSPFSPRGAPNQVAIPVSLALSSTKTSPSLRGSHEGSGSPRSPESLRGSVAGCHSSQLSAARCPDRGPEAVLEPLRLTSLPSIPGSAQCGPVPRLMFSPAFRELLPTGEMADRSTLAWRARLPRRGRMAAFAR